MLGPGKGAVAQALADELRPMIASQPGGETVSVFGDDSDGECGMFVLWDTAEHANAAAVLVRPRLDAHLSGKRPSGHPTPGCSESSDRTTGLGALPSSLTMSTQGGAPMAYPATFELDAPTKVANWRPLVHWFLAIPHWVVNYFLSQIGQLLAVISWFVIVFTGKLPAGLANFQCLVIRYSTRTYTYGFWLREPYPPFDFTPTPADPGGDPVRVDLIPAYEDRNRLTVGLRIIWAIPALLFAIVLWIAAAAVVFVSFFAVLFTGRYPEGMRDFVLRAGRYFVRLTAYLYLLTDEYPPFALE
ncbi:MAG: DUF4389 domain-containing protein [Acidimicrobiales bacterium]